MQKNIERDFNHLSQVLVTDDEPILYELIYILENSLEDFAYRKIAEQNITALATIHPKIKHTLETIVSSNNKDLYPFRLIGQQLLDSIKKS